MSSPLLGRWHLNWYTESLSTLPLCSSEPAAKMALELDVPVTSWGLGCHTPRLFSFDESILVPELSLLLQLALVCFHNSPAD